MIKPIVKDSKVVFGPCRLSYTHVFEKYNPEGPAEDGKYQTNVLVPKDEKETIKAINEAIESARKSAIISKWSGKDPKKIDLPLRDGADKENDGDGVYADCFYLNAKCKDRPGIVDKKKVSIVDEEEVYSGCWCIVSVTFFGYDVSGNKGIACGLNNLMKFKDDEHLGGRTSAANDFESVDFDDEDDDDL
jgi:hypothetical protein